MLASELGREKSTSAEKKLEGELPEEERSAQCLASIRAALAGFLQSHPNAVLKPRDDSVVLLNPWDDESMNLIIRSAEDKIVAVLNGLLLPKLFTAVWHKSERAFEVIWTAYPVADEFKTRSFSFDWFGKRHECAFGPSSEEVQLLAASYEPAGAPTATGHRNLDSFKSFLRWQRAHPNETNNPYLPMSFWIRDFDWDENEAVRFAKHLNFFMTYFDRSSPRILIHGDDVSDITPQRTLRFPFSQFPKSIRGRELDPHLLGLFEGAVEATDTFRRFLHYYQILEYAAFYYVDEKISRTIKQTLLSPECFVDTTVATRRILDAMVDWRVSDEAKIVACLNEMVDPRALWKEVEPLRSHFSAECQFEGGFTAPALIRENWTVEDFVAAWTPKLPDAFRKIRNALVHAREARMVAVILPSTRNAMKLRPWLAPISFAALQVIVRSED